MLNIEEINNTIEDLENSSTTFDTCSKLASLYIVRNELTKQLVTTDKVETELNDILPQYKLYCETKRKYQMHELPESAIQYAISDVCKEIEEFVHILYNNTDTSIEREQIKKLINNLHETF